MTGLTVGYAGMTHLGLNSAVAGAERGFDIVCFDPDVRVIEDLNRGDLPVVEPDLPELFTKNRARLTFSAEASSLAACDVVYVAPDVPTDDRGGSDLSGLTSLIDSAAGQLRADAVLVILSQVPPGFTRGHVRPALTLYYQVETLIFGRAIERALHPERTIVGCADPAEPLPESYRRFLEAFGCPALPVRYESAELCKISINCCLVASISVANTLAELCEGIGAVWSEIVPALKLDRRIGPHAYLAPGLGIAGGNLERDLSTVLRLAEQIGSDSSVPRAWIHNSRYRKDWVLRTLHETVLRVTQDPLVAVLGLAYKENTHSTKNSPSFALIESLPPCRLQVFDPVVPTDSAPHPYPIGVATAQAVCEGADVLAIMTPWPEFRDLDPGEIAKSMTGRTVVDPYAILDGASCRAAGLSYHTLGVTDA